MCPACEQEYRNPADRRFHAQPVCCPECGPRMELVYASEGRARGGRGDPIKMAARLLLEGKIVAIKGLGGFHLAVRADQGAAVERLRALKKRDAKPFAIMVRDMAMAGVWRTCRRRGRRN